MGDDKEWEMIKQHFDVWNYGNRSKYAKTEPVNAVLYLRKTGCQWSMRAAEVPMLQ